MRNTEQVFLNGCYAYVLVSILLLNKPLTSQSLVCPHFSQLVAAPLVSLSSDTRYRHFKLVQPSVLPTHPVLRSSLPRFSTSIFHGLRLASAPLNDFLNHIQCSDASACSCGSRETVSHFLLSCRKYSRQRTTLRAKLRQILNRRRPLSLKLLLGNPLNLPRVVHLRVTRAVCEFISASGRFSRRRRRR